MTSEMDDVLEAIPTASVRPGTNLEGAFRLLVESVQDYAIFYLDPSGIVTTWNQGAERLKGYRASEIIGRHFSVFYDPADVAAGRPRRVLARALADGRFEDEGWRLRKDGTRFWADVIVTAIHDESGAHVGFAKVTRDMTERRAAEEERLRLARAEAAVRLRDEFISIAAHELRTPLQALHVQLLALKVMMQPERFASVGVEAGAARVERLLALTSRLGSLISRLLDISRVARGVMSLERKPMDLVACARGVVAAAEELGARKGRMIRLRGVQSAAGEWDELRIEQVISNLLDNAIKYGGDGPIDIEISVSDGRAVLRVCDDGPGVPPEQRERIFERFTSGKPTSQNPGLGLGLYISREIVHAHGGTLVLEDSRHGACFRMELPTGIAEP